MKGTQAEQASSQLKAVEQPEAVLGIPANMETVKKFEKRASSKKKMKNADVVEGPSEEPAKDAVVDKGKGKMDIRSKDEGPKFSPSWKV